MKKHKTIFILWKEWKLYAVKVTVIDQCVRSYVSVHCPQNDAWFIISLVSVAYFYTAIIQHSRISYRWTPGGKKKTHTHTFTWLITQEDLNACSIHGSIKSYTKVDCL
jgi:hypothetical protein